MDKWCGSIRIKNGKLTWEEGMSGFPKRMEWQAFIRRWKDSFLQDERTTRFPKSKEWQAFIRGRNGRLSKDEGKTGFTKTKVWRAFQRGKNANSSFTGGLLFLIWAAGGLNYNLRRCDKKQLKLNERKDYWKTLMRGDNGSFYNKEWN